MITVHPICKQMRELRRACGMSLGDAEGKIGIASIVLGSYERGDRNPPLSKMEQILNAYGYTLAAVPVKDNAVRLPADMATELRRIADQIERKNALTQPSIHGVELGR